MGKPVNVTGASRAPKKAAIDSAFAAAGDAAAYAADSTEKAVGGDTLLALQALAEELINNERAVLKAKQALANAMLDLEQVQEHTLPDMMEKYSLPFFNFYDRNTGQNLVIKLDSDRWRVTLPPLKTQDGVELPENEKVREAIYQWLRDIGQAGSLDKDLKVALGLADDATVKKVHSTVKELFPDLDAIIKEGINQKRLQALVSRMLKAGENVHEGLQIKAIRQAKVTKK